MWSDGALVLDGLLIEGMVAVDAGDLGRLEVRHCTIGAGADALGPGLLVRSGQAGTNARLSILAAAAILGDIAAATAAGQIAIRDTVIGEDRSAQGDAAASAVLVDAPEADLVVQRATIFGKIVGRTLEADDSIFCGPLAIARRQQGCARFCYVPEGSRTPRRYRCTPDLQLAIAKEQAGGTLAPAQEQAIRERIRPLFTSTMFGHYAFAQLARRCPPEISAGADGGLEMGAMNRLGAPARLANMTDALEEYLPFGLAAGVVFVT